VTGKYLDEKFGAGQNDYFPLFLGWDFNIFRIEVLNNNNFFNLKFFLWFLI